MQGDAFAIAFDKDFDLGVFFLFQFLIGNTDFSIRSPHNVLLLRDPDARIIPVPFDLDSSGAVNASYAVPDKRLGLRNVRMRRYRGFCEPRPILSQVIDYYVERKESLYELYQDAEELTDYSKQKGVDYLDSFFRTIESPEDFDYSMTRDCW